jgi:Fur family ferric uptake transcriptional regulator
LGVLLHEISRRDEVDRLSIIAIIIFRAKGQTVTSKPPQRRTEQRKVLLEELRKSSSHPTASELYQVARKRLPRISLGTVYRNLDRFSREGTIWKLRIAGSEARYDGNPKPHAHVICVTCGRIEDALDMPADHVADRVKTLGGFHVLGHRSEYFGICPGCRACQSKGDSEGMS